MLPWSKGTDGFSAQRDSVHPVLLGTYDERHTSGRSFQMSPIYIMSENGYPFSNNISTKLNIVYKKPW